MNYDVFRQRQQRSRLSLWELGDLLGIHPHLVSDSHSQPLTARPLQAFIEIARRLDIHRPTWSRNSSRC